MTAESPTIADTAPREDLAALRDRATAVSARIETERRHAGIPRRDLSPFAQGAGGIPYAFTFDSGRAGPHVLVTCLAHGNEPGGLEAVVTLLERGIRPVIGRLSLAICNVAAHAATNGVDPYGTRFIEDDFNRLWDDAILDSDRRSVELDRARQLRPLIASADVLLDLHATPYEATPYFVLKPGSRAAALADRIGQPHTRFVFNTGSVHSPTLTNYKQFSDPAGTAVGLTVECGLFFARSSADVALSTIGKLLAIHGLISEETAASLSVWRDPSARRLITVEETQMVQTADVRLLSCPGDFVAYTKGEIAAFDGEAPIRAPFDGAVPLWVKQTFVAGDTAFMWARQSLECQ
ncbi:M14 family metallopeptidase [Chelatococcus asaccharovorans]|uniref:succinylglutamate desuccinylase/aspartoacylase domain-containing protein n=1 Tax=Chelatococcus asaccharovorans TaxID=28210 RepID=UPI00224C769A|nr:succinylglutamate desuccinylase/aspartoacylase family protein [Chelatococcus asaccharovorans]CAH1668309.1 Succinylglutamate desuccinylase [Chelatococcus asaccharovorans]CAH1680232.1 Succinylglutamate desuccinylase [Chelatococcus asaccharovorans]